MSEQEQRASQRLCPYCENPFDSQGLYMHVRNTPGNGHDEAGSVPEGFEPREAPIYDPETDDEVIQTELQGDESEMDYSEQNRLYRCLWCGDDQKGKAALSIHLTKSAGDEMHPEDASTDDENYIRIPADENWNPMLDEQEINQIERKELRDRRIAEHLPGAESSEDTETVQDPDNMAQTHRQTLTSAEVEQRKEEIVIPRDENKTVQVAAVLTQEERFYDRPEVVRDMVGCSSTTFYEGRKLFDNSGGVDVNSREADAAESEPVNGNGQEAGTDEQAASADEEGLTVMVGDTKFVPFDALQEVADAAGDAAEEVVARYR